MKTILGMSLTTLLLSCLCYGQEQARQEPYGAQLETVATFDGPLLTGVTVSNDGRIFVNFPQWGEKPPYTVGEVVNGKTSLIRTPQSTAWIWITRRIILSRCRAWLSTRQEGAFGSWTQAAS